MTASARREYVRRMQVLYSAAKRRRERIRLVAQVRETLGCHRKHAGRLMRGKPPSLERPFRLRKRVYPDRLISILESVWEATQHLWSVRLKAALPLWMGWIKKRWSLSSEEERLLLAMSPATIDRRLGPYKRRLSRKIYGGTRPGRWLRQTIPIQTESWNVPEPGWTEADTVSHSGSSGSGIFAFTLNQVDLFSGWVEMKGILGKGFEEVVPACDELRQGMPFDQKGMDTDCGEEFINYKLDRWCRAKGVKRFRSRPYKKNDQAHIEQKNGTHVRRLIGWDRYDTQEAVDAMNSLYRQEWRLLANLFLPSVKLANKIRVGSRIKRVYEDAKTPLDRLWDSGKGDRDKLQGFRRTREGLDPFDLSKTVEGKLEFIWKLASRAPIKAAPATVVRPKRSKIVLEDYAAPPLFLPHRDSYMEQIRKNHSRDKFLGTS